MVNEENREASTPLYLEVQDILGFYADIFDCTPRQASDQLRDRAGLEGAPARPRHYALYAEADLALQAAVLAHGIAEGQPSVEGNKRTALVTLRAFLLVNGFQVTAPQSERFRWMLRLSEGRTAEELADLIRPSLQPVLGH